MTVDEFRQLNLPEHYAYELRDGELIEMTRPKFRHSDLQYRLSKLLEPIAATYGRVQAEFAFRPTPEYNLRAADVAIVAFDRLHTIDPEDNLHGAPDLVIEVESPSNTAAELDEKESICLANGCKEFWIVYPKRKVVRVATGDSTKRYQQGEMIPLLLFPGHGIAVSDIFAAR
jgi:Uma2 family endonuclease